MRKGHLWADGQHILHLCARGELEGDDSARGYRVERGGPEGSKMVRLRVFVRP